MQVRTPKSPPRLVAARLTRRDGQSGAAFLPPLTVGRVGAAAGASLRRAVGGAELVRSIPVGNHGDNLKIVASLRTTTRPALFPGYLSRGYEVLCLHGRPRCFHPLGTYSA